MMKIKHLYIHVPFCRCICHYCDFAHHIYNKNVADKWLDTLEKEIKDNCFDQYETIYIGGGTPTCLDLQQLDRLLLMIEPFSKNIIEYTIEINPESLDLDKILLFKKYHLNRFSIGVQTSDNDILKSLNRKHTFSDAVNAIILLKKNGFNNISVDLMYSLPDQSIQILDNTIDDILKLNVPHISLYSLTIEENTVFGKKNIKPQDIEIEADMYELIDRKLKSKNYIHYEVSNFCIEDKQSKHNMAYWNYEDFLGLSIGASSKIGNHRYSNTRNFNKYFEYKDIKDEDLYLSVDDLKFEHIMMSLRTIYGLNIGLFNQKYCADLINDYAIGLSNPNVYINNGYLKVKNFEILNNTLLDFMP